ncbi:MAG: hypothetical protein JWQ21_1352 [Herminiimonas sp.]|nr:hypothetical protein [Herminiimonas sp.]
MDKSLVAFALSATLLLAPFSAAIAQTCSRQSPPYTIALLELYTSEGCDSCPPANKFVSTLRHQSLASGLTAGQVVPLALHVDYWDYIGWKDLFGKHAFTERQHWLSDLANTRTVYTPEIFIAGRELRNWSDGVPAAVKRINARPAQADIAIALGKISNGSLPVEVNAKAAGGKLFIALYENGLVTDIKAGENRGVTLKEDYVVRDWIGPIALPADAKGGKAALPRALTVPADSVTKNLGVAAFVQTDKGEVLQTLSLPLCEE